MFMNEYEVEEMFLRAKNDNTPNRERGATILYNLMQWTNRNSDGWAYWPKPSRAARRLMEVLSKGDHVRYVVPIWPEDRPEDISSEELKAGLAPIKAFLTRMGVAHEEVFDNYLTT